MKTSELIEQLKEAMTYNGDQELVIMVDGKPFQEIELNCPGDDAPLYIEGYTD